MAKPLLVVKSGTVSVPSDLFEKLLIYSLEADGLVDTTCDLLLAHQLGQLLAIDQDNAFAEHFRCLAWWINNRLRSGWPIVLSELTSERVVASACR